MRILNHLFFLFVIGILSACSSDHNSVEENALVPVQEKKSSSTEDVTSLRKTKSKK